MNLTNMLTCLAKISDVNNPIIFPFPFKLHISLAVISLIFFSYRFAVQKKPYQLVFAVAAPISLLLWISNNRTLFYTVGAIELILFLIAIFTTIFSKPNEAETSASSDKKAKED
ncbi:hypothetical protein [Ruminococcus flavefaciens]|uniref:hypothetical protein n=1 Tax=Ruminococcus flavefaciens TaxID=1265 RepID=UPI00048C4E7D|nr:hypothetical protein [Ruminococcus flavefaciens]